MSLVTRIVGPVDPEAARWAMSLNDPAGGRLAIVVPPALASLAALVGELLGALGKPAAANPRFTAGVEELALGRAWLRAHDIERVLLVHADWLPHRIADELCAYAALTGVDLECVVTGRDPDPYLPWSGEEIGWVELVERVTREQLSRATLADDAARHQRELLPPLGMPAETARIVPGALDAFGRSAFVDLAGRIKRDGRTEGSVARSLALVLRTFPAGEPFDSAVRGAASALAQSGWALLSNRLVGPAEPSLATWADLRTGVLPHQPAAVGLVATGLWPDEIATLRVQDVAEDGSWVLGDGVPLEVPRGARLYLVAQRMLSDRPEDPFLHNSGRPFRPLGVSTTISATLADAGLAVPAHRFRRPASPSGRWLAERGLAVRPADAGRVIVRKTPVCEHGLPRELVVDGVVLSHSQKLCLGDGPAELRPWTVRSASNGFTVSERERSELGVRYGVSRADGPAGELVGLATDQGLVWVQVGTGNAPGLGAIAAAATDRRQ